MIAAPDPVSLTRPARDRGAGLLGLLGAVVALLAVAGLALGPVTLSPAAVLAALAGHGEPMAEAIVLHIRAPRVLLGLGVGAGLALAGMALQGVLRNPLADPGLIGVTAGAALGAVSVIVLGGWLVGNVPGALRPWLMPMAAFGGAGLVTAFVFGLSRRGGAVSVPTLILAGVAVNAIAGAGIGALIYVSDDQQLRDLTFWSMGSLGAAAWLPATLAAGCIAAAGAGLARMARPLDLLQLGERAAFHAGLDVERAKRRVALGAALAVGAGTAVAGPIGFVGLVAPHLARLVVGPAHRLALPAAALLGAGLLLAADLGVRLAVPPAEPPIGLATSMIGGPFFLWLLLVRMERGDA